MLETIPLKCYECEELFDLPAELSTGETATCPMCGAVIDIHRAELFDLPCPPGVVIEEVTPERLCLYARKSPRGSDDYYLGIGCLVIGAVIGVLCLAYAALNVKLLVGWWGPSIWAAIAVGLYSSFSFTLLVGRQSVEVKNSQMIIRFRSGPFTERLILKTSEVIAVVLTKEKSTLWPFRKSNWVVRAKMKKGSPRIYLSPTPKPARFIAHLIRRQLDSLHDPLQYPDNNSQPRRVVAGR